MNNYWSVEGRVQQLKDLHKQGHSCQTIANMMGGAISRSAIIGKLHRLGLCGAPNLKRFADGRVQRPRTHRTRRPQRPPQLGPHANVLLGSFSEYEAECIAKEKPLAPGVPPMTILERRADGCLQVNERFHAGCCRWPIGDPTTPEFRFCGDTKVLGRAYCEAHLWRATDGPVRVHRAALVAPAEPVQNNAPAAALSRVPAPA